MPFGPGKLRLFQNRVQFGYYSANDVTHSNSQMLFWGHTAEEPPTDLMTIGHENTGYIVAVGKSVTGLSIGDHVGCLGSSYACCKSIGP